MSFKRAARLTAFCSILFIPALAPAGPPFRTDDPEPVEPGHYEFYTFSTMNRHKEDVQAILPGFEFNYGAAPGIQLHIIAPLIRDEQLNGASSPDPYAATYNYGDTELGAKIRFTDEDRDGWLPQIGIYPLYEAPTGNKYDNTGKGHGSAYLPLWLQKSLGRYTWFGGGGYWINPGTSTNRIPGPSQVTTTIHNYNYWFAGVGFLYDITSALHVGSEMFHQSHSTDQPDGIDQTGFNIGGIWDATENDHLMASAGRGIVNATHTNMFSYYVAYQRTW